MTTKISVRRRLTQASWDYRQAIKALRAEIMALGDNPRIRRVGATGFIISSSDLGAAWSPEYHDFRHQYRHVVLALTATGPSRALWRLKRIISGRQVVAVGNRVRLHPDVVEKLQKILEES